MLRLDRTVLSANLAMARQQMRSELRLDRTVLSANLVRELLCDTVRLRLDRTVLSANLGGINRYYFSGVAVGPHRSQC